MKAKRMACTLVGAGLAGAAALAGYIYAVRPWHMRWGATDLESAMPLPGDDLVPKPKFRATHGITIEAPPSALWPWLVQLGHSQVVKGDGVGLVDSKAQLLTLRRVRQRVCEQVLAIKPEADGQVINCVNAAMPAGDHCHGHTGIVCLGQGQTELCRYSRVVDRR